MAGWRRRQTVVATNLWLATQESSGGRLENHHLNEEQDCHSCAVMLFYWAGGTRLSREYDFRWHVFIKERGCKWGKKEVRTYVNMCCAVVQVLLSQANVIILTVLKGSVSKFNYWRGVRDDAQVSVSLSVIIQYSLTLNWETKYRDHQYLDCVHCIDFCTF